MSTTRGRKRRINTISAPGDGTTHAAESADFDAATASFIRYCRVKNLAPLTISYYDDVLKDLRKLLDRQGVTEPRAVTREVLEKCIEDKRGGGVKDVTVERNFRGWRAFFNWMADSGYIPVSPAAGVRMKSEQRVIETFTKPQIRKLLDTPDRSTFTGYRDYVLMSLLLDTGVRISEAEGIRVTDIAWSDRVIRVYGKGRKERLVPFQLTLERHLREYINVRGPLEHDFLFVNIDNSPMKKRSMQQNIADYGRESGIKGVRISPHTFRHTFAKFYVMNGGDAFSLQKILGHTSLDIVRMYVNLFSVDVAKMHRKFSPLERLGEDDEY